MLFIALNKSKYDLFIWINHLASFSHCTIFGAIFTKNRTTFSAKKQPLFVLAVKKQLGRRIILLFLGYSK